MRPPWEFNFVINTVKKVTLVAALALRSLSTIFYFISYVLAEKVFGFEDNRGSSITRALMNKLADSAVTLSVGVNYLFGKCKLMKRALFTDDLQARNYGIEHLKITDLIRIGAYAFESNVRNLDYTL